MTRIARRSSLKKAPVAADPSRQVPPARERPPARIAEFPRDNEDFIQQAASILVEAFREHWPDAWPTVADALSEVRKDLEADRTGRIDLVATDRQGRVIGWIGGTSQYSGKVWELHPLAVQPASQGRGIGSALVFDLEQRVRDRGGLTIWLGSDDEDNMTTVSGVDLFPAPLKHLVRIRNLRRHPYEFYKRLGYALIGVMPDANGPGKPDIFLAKSLAR